MRHQKIFQMKPQAMHIRMDKIEGSLNLAMYYY